MLFSFNIVRPHNTQFFYFCSNSSGKFYHQLWPTKKFVHRLKKLFLISIELVYSYYYLTDSSFVGLKSC